MARTRTLEIDVPDSAMRRIKFEAGRRGMTAEGYVREVIMREVDVMPRWSFEVEFDEGLAAAHGTSAGELYGIVADIAERNGNVRVGRNMWMAGEDGEEVESQCLAHSALRRNALVMSCLSHWVIREDGETFDAMR